MTHFTSITYQMKREILSFSNKISQHLSRPDKKFSADMTYGILASESCLLTDISDQLHENSKKVNTVKRLTRHLDKGVPPAALQSYLSMIRSMAPSDPVIFIDDSDIVMPDGKRTALKGKSVKIPQNCENTHSLRIGRLQREFTFQRCTLSVCWLTYALKQIYNRLKV